MFKEIVVVDENIRETLRREETESAKQLNCGVGLWGMRALKYIFSDEPLWDMQIELEETGRINNYGKLIDKKAAQLYETMRPKLAKLPQYKMTGDFMSDLQKNNEIKHIIEEQIYAELIYVKELVRP